MGRTMGRWVGAHISWQGPKGDKAATLQGNEGGIWNKVQNCPPNTLIFPEETTSLAKTPKTHNQFRATTLSFPLIPIIFNMTCYLTPIISHASPLTMNFRRFRRGGGGDVPKTHFSPPRLWTSTPWPFPTQIPHVNWTMAGFKWVIIYLCLE